VCWPASHSVTLRAKWSRSLTVWRHSCALSKGEVGPPGFYERGGLMHNTATVTVACPGRRVPLIINF
jgi:hypothetical protein